MASPERHLLNTPHRAPLRFAAVPSVEIHGLTFSNVTARGCVDEVLQRCAAGIGGWVITPNLDILRQCAESDEIRDLVNAADLVVADGMPLLWASRLQGTPLPERVCGSDLIWSVPEGAAERGLSIYLLGGADDTAERAAEVLQRHYPSLRIVGTYAPPFGFEKDDEEIARIRAAVERAAPDIIFVALSFPKGERLIQRIRSSRPRAWWLGVGISFSFVCGRIPRAPRWMRIMGLEWVYRLYQEPRRLFKRYLIDDIPFALRLLWRASWRRLSA